MLNANAVAGKEAYFVHSGIVVYLLLCVWIVFNYDGTGDSGDSVLHFQYAQFAFEHPDNFFSHWAKPLFTLFAAPFAQFGFVGIKLFNVLNNVLSLYLVYRIATRIKLPLAWLAPLLLATCTLYFTLTFSGLTEHFSALILLISISLYIEQKFIWAAIILSFLPFVRSEGMLFIGVMAGFMLLDKLWKYIPLLGLGHLVYALAGAAYYNGDVFRVFNKIPYAALSAYGKGDWFHFVEQLYYAAGLPQYILGLLGIFGVLGLFVIPKLSNNYSNPTRWAMLLILACFGALVGAHTAFWALGIFNSFGITRVLNTVMPEFALLGCFGLGLLCSGFKNAKFYPVLVAVFALLISIMPFSNNPAAIAFPRYFVKNQEQQLVAEVDKFIKEQYPHAIVYYTHPSVGYYMDLDPFDTTKTRPLAGISTVEKLPENSILVWDSWFSVIQDGLGVENLQNDPRLLHLKTIESKNPPFTYAIFKLKSD